MAEMTLRPPAFTPGTIVFADNGGGAPGAGQVMLISPGASPTLIAAGLNNPVDVLAAPDGNLYVSEGIPFPGGQILQIDPFGVVTPFLTNLNAPLDLVFDYGRNRILFTDVGSNLWQVPLTGGPPQLVYADNPNNLLGIAPLTDVTQDGGYLLVRPISQTVEFVPPVGPAFTFPIAFGANPTYVDLAPTNLAYVAVGNQIIEFTPDPTFPAARTIIPPPLGAPIVGLAVDPTVTGLDLIVTAGQNIIRLDPITGNVVATIGPFVQPTGIDVILPPDHHFLPTPNQEPRRNPDMLCLAGRGPCPEEIAHLDVIDDSLGSGNFLDSGDFFITETDLAIPGRGIDYELGRTYRNQTMTDGSLGYNWQHNYDARLFALGNDLIYVSPNGRQDTYTSTNSLDYFPPTGYYTNLIRDTISNTVKIIDRDGSFLFFEPVEGTETYWHLTQLGDRKGNTLTFLYDSFGFLTTAIDTLGRPITYNFDIATDRQIRLLDVTDFSGRQVSYEYDGEGNLIGVTSPTVIATPHGNDFPVGKTTAYTYSGSNPLPALDHNLHTIIAPNEVADSSNTPHISNNYGTTPGLITFDRIITQTIGGTNSSGISSGGSQSFEYAILLPCFGGDSNIPATTTTVTDRKGFITTYEYDCNGHRVTDRTFTNGLRPDDPAFFTTSHTYDATGQRLNLTLPEGNQITWTYDGLNSDVRQQGNRLSQTHIPDGVRLGDQATITSTWTYEPIYNQIRAEFDPRGQDAAYVPPNGGATSPNRYRKLHMYDYEEACDFVALADQIGRTPIEVEAALTNAGICLSPLGDINGDGLTTQFSGNVIQITYPTIRLDENSNMAAVEGSTSQPIVEYFTYNDFGQLVTATDPEGNVETFIYNTEQDPDGDTIINNPSGDPTTGGYLAEVIYDSSSGANRNSNTNPTPAAIRQLYDYDPVGNIIHQVNGRGIATTFVVNELNQTVVITYASAISLFTAVPTEPLTLTNYSYTTRLFYDANDNVVLRQVEDRGNTSNTDGNITGLPPLYVSNPDPLGGPAFIDSQYEYDILDNGIRRVEEVKNDGALAVITTTYRYDGNENRVLTIFPEGNAASRVYDERDLLFQDVSGAKVPPAAGLLGGSDSTNYDVRGGDTATITYRYDDNRNLIEVADAADTDNATANNSDSTGIGDRSRYLYDGYDRLVSEIDAVGNQTVHQYDPASNIIRTLHFGPKGGISPTSDGGDLLAIPVSNNGIIQPTNLIVTTVLAIEEYAYDELDRHFRNDRVLFVDSTTTIRPSDVLDGATVIGKGDLTPGDNTAVSGIDDITILGRVTTLYEFDRNGRVTFMVEDDEDTTHTFYDGIDRIIRTIDPEGNETRYAYDDNDNVIEVAETEKAQLAGIADEIFVTTYFYDSLDRLQQTVDNGGQSTNYRYDSRNNLVARADALGPVTGITITRRSFAGGSLTVNGINDFGNVTRYSYDGLNRQVTSEVILTLNGMGDGVHIGATLVGIKSATPTPDISQGGSDGRILTQYNYDRNSLTTSVTDDNGNRTNYTYDNLDRQVTETAGSCTAPFLADRCDPPTTKTYLYDPDHNVVRLTDENGSILNHRYDGLNRRITTTITRAASITGTTILTYTYDGLSRLRSNGDNNDPADSSDDAVITYAYDSLNRIIEETQRLGSNPVNVVSSAYRADDLRIELTYPNGRVISSTYDALDRLNQIVERPLSPPVSPTLTMTVSGADAVVGWQHVGTTERGSNVWVPNYRVWTSVNPYFTLTDTTVLLLATVNIPLTTQTGDPITTTDAGAVGSAGAHYYRATSVSDTGLASDLSNTVGEFTFTIQSGAAAKRDDGGKAKMAPTTPQFNALVVSSGTLVDYDYVGGDQRVLTREYGNGVRLTALNDSGTAVIGYDGVRRITSWRHLDSSNSLIVGFAHIYDRVNNKLSEDKLNDGVNDEMYAYDSAYRLTNFTRPTIGSTPPLHSSWTLDGMGNWSQVDTETRLHTSFNEIYDKGGTAVLSDDNGNETDDTMYRYTYDGLNRLRQVVRVADGRTVATYDYDGLGRRLRSTISHSGALNGTTLYAYDGPRVIEEQDDTGIVQDQFVYGNGIDEVLLRDRDLTGDGDTTDTNDQRLYYHENVIGSPFALTDSTGVITEAYQYDAYGTPLVYSDAGGDMVWFTGDEVTATLSIVSNPYLFTGRRYEVETGLYFYRARHYSPENGRFLQRDPIGAWGDLFNRGNAYTYVGSNPVNWTDPLGLWGWDPNDTFEKLPAKYQRMWQRMRKCGWRFARNTGFVETKVWDQDDVCHTLQGESTNINVEVTNEYFTKQLKAGIDVQWEDDAWAVDFTHKLIYIDEWSNHNAAVKIRRILDKIKCGNNKNVDMHNDSPFSKKLMDKAQAKGMDISIVTNLSGRQLRLISQLSKLEAAGAAQYVKILLDMYGMAMPGTKPNALFFLRLLLKMDEFEKANQTFDSSR